MNTAKMQLYLITIICFVGSIYLSINPNDVEKEYKERGIPVEATIYEITPRLGKKTQDYTCYYLDDNGERVYASMVLNKLDGKVGDKVQGAYLPESPDYVYCQASKSLKFGALALFYGVTILLVIASVMTFMPEKEKTKKYTRRDNSPYRVKPVPIKSSFVGERMVIYDNEDTIQEEKENFDNDSTKKSSTGLKLKN